MNQIRGFQGEYAWLSNFWPCKVVIGGWEFESAENAYQASKSNQLKDWSAILKMTPGQAKRYGRKIHIHWSDWDNDRLEIMREIIEIKFQDPDLRTLLIATEEAEIIEENIWGDTFWGVCNGVGKNHLGKILMEVRTNLKLIER